MPPQVVLEVPDFCSLPPGCPDCFFSIAPVEERMQQESERERTRGFQVVNTATFCCTWRGWKARILRLCGMWGREKAGNLPRLVVTRCGQHLAYFVGMANPLKNKAAWFIRFQSCRLWVWQFYGVSVSGQNSASSICSSVHGQSTGKKL